MRGFLKGVIWGLAFAIVCLGVLSILTPLAPPPAVSEDADAPPPAAEPVNGDAAIPEAGGRDADLVADQPAQPEITVEEDQAPGAVAVDEAGSIAKPDAAQATEDLTQPSQEDSASAGALGNAAGSTPETPAAPTPAPVVPDGDTSPSIDVSTPPEPAEETTPENPEAPAATPQLPEDPPPVESEILPQANPDTAVSSPEAQVAPEQATPEKAERIADLPQAGSDAAPASPRIGKKVVPLTDRDAGAAEPAAEQAEPVGQEPAEEADQSPLHRFAAQFDAPQDMPLVAVIVVDDGGMDGKTGDRAALEDLDFPMTVALDASASNAAERMASLRAAGHEVLVTVDLPTVSAAQDAEVALAAMLGTLDQAIGLLEGDGEGIRGNAALTRQVIAHVQDAGLGLVTHNSGLNTPWKLAQKDGVPSGKIFRDVDGAGQDAAMILRYLDQAAFRAAQGETVILVARARPATLTALKTFTEQGERTVRARLAPVSAVLAKGAVPPLGN